MSHAYRLATLKLVSDIELPELTPWEGRPEIPAALRFRVGRVPAGLRAPDHRAPGFETQGRERYLLAEADRMLIEHGRSVTVEPAPGTDLADARALLMGPVQAVLWHQRGLLPLHASVVDVGGRAVALAGASRAGKSTLAAALSAGRHPVLADDVAVIDTAGVAEVLPTSRRLRLWRQALDHFGIAVDSLPRALSRSEKFLVDCGARAGSQRRPLAAIVLLARRGADAVALAPVRGARSIIELQGVVHMLPAAQALGLAPAVFAHLTKLSRHGVQVWRLAMPDDCARLDEAIEKILAVVDDGPSPRT